MPVSKLTVFKGRTVNIGNYSNVKFDYGIEYTLSDGEKVADVKEKLEVLVDKMIDDEHSKWVKS